MNSSQHIPVLVKEVMENLALKEGMTAMDLTVGAGGHAREILNVIGEEGRLIACDRDPRALQIAGKNLSKRENYELIQANFSDLELITHRAQISQVDAVLVDLGVSSMQLDDAARGFSYMRDGPLDLRMDQGSPKKAEDIVNKYEEEELVEIFKKYGELKAFQARKLARLICEERLSHKIERTHQLLKLIDLLAKKKNKSLAPQVFQALRIELNDELGSLETFLNKIPNFLAKKARLAIISFHSLEDRIVKNAFKKGENPCICPRNAPVCVCGQKSYYKIITRKSIRPSKEEIERNPRSRSAKLRVVEKT